MKSKPLLSSLFALSIALVSKSAAAGPNSSDVDELFTNFGLEGRGMFGTSGSFSSPAVVGGDGHLVLEAGPGSLLIGGRLGSDLKTTQFALFDAGIRYFLNDEAVTALFVGGGGFYGPEYVNGFQFQTGDIAGIYGEVGYELPRDSNVRGIASLRGDLGGAQQRDVSKIEPTPFYGVLSLNLGFMFGGDGTKAEHHHDADRTPAPEEPITQ